MGQNASVEFYLLRHFLTRLFKHCVIHHVLLAASAFSDAVGHALCVKLA